MIPITILLEPMTECMLLGLLSAWAVFYLFYWDPISFFLIHVLVWFLMDWILIHIVQNGSLPCNKFEFLVSKIDPMRQILTWVESLLYIRCNLRCLYLYLLFWLHENLALLLFWRKMTFYDSDRIMYAVWEKREIFSQKIFREIDSL